MATLTTSFPTLLDISRATNSQQSIGAMIEILAETNEIVKDLSMIEGKGPSGSLEVIVRTGLGKPTFRGLNEYVKPSHSTSDKSVFNPAILEDWAIVDSDLANLHGNAAAYRSMEVKAKLEAMSQTIAHTIFHGDQSVDPRQFDGLNHYYDAFNSTAGTPGSENMLDGKTAFSTTAATGSDHLTSIWLICTGPDKITGFYPSGLNGGFQTEDHGRRPLQGTSDTASDYNAAPGFQSAWVSRFTWNMGIAPVDWRYAVRIPNLRTTMDDLTGYLTAGGNTAFVSLPEIMHSAKARIPNMSVGGSSEGKLSWYMSRPMKAKLESILARTTNESSLSMDEVGGKTMQTWGGVPVRMVDALATDESLVT